jgi:hypothetical protein
VLWIREIIARIQGKLGGWSYKRNRICPAGNAAATPALHPSNGKLGAIMIEDKNEASLRRAGPDEDPNERRGVVISLAAHRRWRSQCLSSEIDFDEVCEGLEWEPDWAPDWAHEEELPERPVVAATREPSLWLAVVAGLSALMSMVAVYWAFVTAIRGLFSLSFVHF